MNDHDIGDLFAATPAYDDHERFAMRVDRALHLKLWLRQGLIVLAGFIGGIYALAQFIRVPGGLGQYDKTLKSAAGDADRTLRASAEMFDMLHIKSTDMFDSWSHALSLMQTPLFFWVSFSLCLAALGLYYAYSQEETI